jgi:hypothetical protein
LTTAPRERLVNRRLARTLADRPRPKVLARGLLRRPRLETRPLLGGSERLGDERLRALRPLGADAAGTDAEIIVPRHGRAPNTSRKLQQSQ